MKTIAWIPVLVMLVTVVAVSGSWAQPLPTMSVAFQQCLEQTTPLGERCTSAVGVVAGADEVGGERATDPAGYGDFGHVQGGDLSSPELWAGLRGIVFLDNFAARLALQYLFGGGTAAHVTTAHAAAVIFDPVK